MGLGFGITKTSSGGGGGGTTITTVANYSALPSASSVGGRFFWCEASQGTKWLPFSVGGTYYPLGMYYSNGVTWEYTETPYQATLSEVNTGTNTDKFVSPYTFENASKWNNYVTSVGLTMPTAFTVTNSPITSSGTIAVAGAGTSAQYIRGDGQLSTFPTSTGGGSSLSYYLNGSVNQGTFGGNTYYQMSKTPIIGVGTDFSINADGFIARFITDANDPSQLSVPSGNWNLEFFFSASSSGGTPTFYVNIYKYNGTTFTLLGTNSTAPEGITNGTVIDSYFTAVSIASSALNITDRLAIEIYVVHSGRTITLHTEDNHLDQIITTFSSGLTALNGLTSQVQYFATGTSGTDFNIDSVTDTHTFNLPTASATNRGALSSEDWTTFSGKQNALTIGDLTDIGTDGISITGGTGAIIGGGVNISQQVASATQNGYLSSTDWNTFNSANFIPKLSATETYRGININNNSTTVVTEGGVTMSSSASTTAQSVASTNFSTKQIRLRYSATVVSGGRYTGTRGSALLWFIHGGFRFICDFNISDTAYSANCQQFYGLAGQTTDLSYGGVSGTLVSTLINVVGIGSEVGDANLQIFHNDGTGTATKIDLGVDFPSNRTVGAISTTVYSIQLYNQTASNEIKYEVKNNETGALVSGTISTNLPLNSQGLNFFASRCMSTSSVTNTGQFDLMKLGVYSQL
jgi:hypothetical protein